MRSQSWSNSFCISYPLAWLASAATKPASIIQIIQGKVKDWRFAGFGTTRKRSVQRPVREGVPLNQFALTVVSMSKEPFRYGELCVRSLADIPDTRRNKAAQEYALSGPPPFAGWVVPEWAGRFSREGVELLLELLVDGGERKCFRVERTTPREQVLNALSSSGSASATR